MPELPEVETTRLGIAPAILHQAIDSISVRQAALRWPITASLSTELPGLRFDKIDRRGKYLLLHTSKAVLLIHLGMSGSLRLVNTELAAGKHDHVDIVFASGLILRFTDPRRFGCMLWINHPALAHPLLKNLGPEPLSEELDGNYLKVRSKGKSVAVKNFIMDSNVVVGVGNIYANEALFNAGIHPKRSAGRISLRRYERLADEIKKVLHKALQAGGTTLRDFSGSDGKPGYFKQSLQVYGRGGEPCAICKNSLREIRIGQRSTVFCRHCQK